MMTAIGIVWRSSLSARVLLASFLFVMCFVAVCGVVGVTWVSARLRAVQFDSATALGDGLMTATTAAMATDDRVGAHVLLQQAAEANTDIRYIVALTADRDLAAHSLARAPAAAFVRTIGAPRDTSVPLRLHTELGLLNDVVVRSRGQRGPELHIGVADGAVAAATNTLKLALGFAIVAGLAVGGVLAVALASWISGPLLEAAQATDAIAATLVTSADDAWRSSRPTEAPLQVTARSSVREVAVLIDSFNRLSRLLHHSQVGLEKARRSLVQTERMAALGTFVAGTAHAINNPLGGVRACLEMVESSPADADKRARYVGLARAATGRIEALVQRLIHFVNVGAGKVGVVAVDALVGNTLALDRLAGKERGVELRFVPGAGNERVAIAPAELEQAVTNLVVNAIQASAPGTEVVVETRVDRDDDGTGHVVITVQDRGPGIPAELHDKVFEPFFSTKPEGEGTGLGLWIVWETARRHGGEARIEPSAYGTRVGLRLPIAAPEEAADG